MTPKPTPTRTTGTLGTFAGVFTPSILTILGIILFLRLGFVVGSAGLMRALVIIGLANVISVLTSVSLSAIATNLKVKGGGDYYLISRTLGPGFGGAIGIVLFLAQSVSIAFYCIGFGEAVSALLPMAAALSPRLIAAGAVGFLFVLAWLGADFATKFQFVVMGLLAAALVSFFWGGLPDWNSRMLAANWATPAGSPPFWVLFAIFFPAVTGFTQGVSMSGDLKEPGRSLPLGTFSAVGLSILVYFGAALVFAGVLPNAVTSTDYGAMRQVARFGGLVDAGVVAATLSSAMASFLGAPRILQSLAGDRIFPVLTPFAEGAGPLQNPRRGVLLSAAIAFLTIALGNLNVVAPVVSMFFLISYGLLNYATYYEARTFSPSFRPRFRWFDYRVSLIGALACLGVILAIDVATGAVAGSILFGLYQYVKRTTGPARWADSHRSYTLQRIREHLLSIAAEPDHARDWRPQILAFSDDPERRGRLLTFASWIEGKSGLTTAIQILEGSGAGIRKKRDTALTALREDLAERSIRAFPLVVSAPDLQTGTEIAVQAFGLGPLKANTVLLNWLSDTPGDSDGFRLLRFGNNVKVAYRLGRNLVLLKTTEAEWEAVQQEDPATRRIDVWWFDDATSRLALLLAYLTTRSPIWEDARIRVLTACPDGSDACRQHLIQTLEDVRIDADAETVPEARPDTLREASGEADLVFLPFRFHYNTIQTPFDAPIEELLSRLPITALVLAAEDMELDAEPEEGAAGDIAVARDRAADARKQLKSADRDTEKAQERLERKRRGFADAVESGAAEETVKATKADLDAARAAADQAFRKAAKMRAKVEQAEKELKKLGVAPEEKASETPSENGSA